MHWRPKHYLATHAALGEPLFDFNILQGHSSDEDISMGPKQVMGHLGAAEKAEWKAPREVRNIYSLTTLNAW
jgi:hypothetical protein